MQNRCHTQSFTRTLLTLLFRPRSVTWTSDRSLLDRGQLKFHKLGQECEPQRVNPWWGLVGLPVPDRCEHTESLRGANRAASYR